MNNSKTSEDNEPVYDNSYGSKMWVLPIKNKFHLHIQMCTKNSVSKIRNGNLKKFFTLKTTSLTVNIWYTVKILRYIRKEKYSSRKLQ